LPLHLLFERIGSLPPSDAGLIKQFRVTRDELKERETNGWARVIEWTEHVHVTAHGASKGFVYSTKVPGELVASLDLCWLWPWRPRPAYRRIEGDWFLYLD